MVLWVGRQCMIVYDNGYTYFPDVCRDTELTKVESGMRRDFYSVMPDHLEASTRVN